MNIKFLGMIILLVIAFFYGVYYGMISPNGYFLGIATTVFIWSIISLSLNLQIGYTGLTNLGHAGSVGIGAYTSAILTLKLGMSFWVALPVAGLVAALFGVLIGVISLRTKEVHFAIITLMIGIMLYVTFQSWGELTGGYLGMRAPRPSDINLLTYTISFKSPATWYFLTLVVFLLVAYMCQRLVKSKIGLTFISIREDELLSVHMGTDIRKYKILSCVISCFLAGVAGSLLAHYITFINPECFKYTTSLEIITFTCFGGVGTIAGPIFGVFSLKTISEYFQFLAYYRMILYGIIIILILRFMPQGVYPFLKNKIKGFVKSLG